MKSEVQAPRPNPRGGIDFKALFNHIIFCIWMFIETLYPPAREKYLNPENPNSAAAAFRQSSGYSSSAGSGGYGGSGSSNPRFRDMNSLRGSTLRGGGCAGGNCQRF